MLRLFNHATHTDAHRHGPQLVFRTVDLASHEDRLFVVSAYKVLMRENRLPRIDPGNELLIVRGAQQHWRDCAQIGTVAGRPAVYLSMDDAPNLGADSILNLAVDPAFRRKGLGLQALRHGEFTLACRGRRHARLTSQLCNKGARAFYEAAGWTYQGPSPELKTDLKWTKRLEL